MHCPKAGRPGRGGELDNRSDLGLIRSIDTVGDCTATPPWESFWGSTQVELNRQRWRTNLELAVAIVDHIEHFYNAAWRTARSAHSRRTNWKPFICPKPRPRCLKEWSTEWGQLLSERTTGFEPATLTLAMLWQASCLLS